MTIFWLFVSVSHNYKFNIIILCRVYKYVLASLNTTYFSHLSFLRIILTLLQDVFSFYIGHGFYGY